MCLSLPVLAISSCRNISPQVLLSELFPFVAVQWCRAELRSTRLQRWRSGSNVHPSGFLTETFFCISFGFVFFGKFFPKKSGWEWSGMRYAESVAGKEYKSCHMRAKSIINDKIKSEMCGQSGTQSELWVSAVRPRRWHGFTGLHSSGTTCWISGVSWHKTLGFMRVSAETLNKGFPPIRPAAAVGVTGGCRPHHCHFYWQYFSFAVH